MAEEVQEEEGGLRSQMWKHEAMVAWLNEQYGVDLDQMSAADIIAYAFAGRVAWRKSDEYQSLVAAHAETAAEEKAAKAKARAEAKAAKEAAEKAEKSTTPAKAAAKKAPAKQAAKKAPAKKAPAKGKAAEDPFS